MRSCPISLHSKWQYRHIIDYIQMKNVSILRIKKCTFSSKWKRYLAIQIVVNTKKASLEYVLGIAFA